MCDVHQYATNPLTVDRSAFSVSISHRSEIQVSERKYNKRFTNLLSIITFRSFTAMRLATACIELHPMIERLASTYF